jgi:hypothetical protein
MIRSYLLAAAAALGVLPTVTYKLLPAALAVEAA